MLKRLELEPEPDNAEAKAKVLAVAHTEDVSGWVNAIAQWMELKCDKETVSLKQLQQSLGMPLVNIWLGLLLGGQEQYGLEQQNAFYEAPDKIFVFKR